MTEHTPAQQQFAERLRTAVGKQNNGRFGSLRRRTRSSNRTFADRLRSSLDAR